MRDDAHVEEALSQEIFPPKVDRDPTRTSAFYIATRKRMIPAVNHGGITIMQRILRRRDLRAVTGYAPTRIHELIEEGKFPRPVPLGERAIGWLESDIAEWQRQRIAERDAIAEKGKATVSRAVRPVRVVVEHTESRIVVPRAMRDKGATTSPEGQS
jgi:prophage regulatory protein